MTEERKLNPFTFVDSINTKKEIEWDEDAEKAYAPFIVNNALSYHVDCVMYANEMNAKYDLSKKLQFDFLRHAIRQKKRFGSKWAKKSETFTKDIEAIQEYYGFSYSKALTALTVLSKQDLEEIKKKNDKGG